MSTLIDLARQHIASMVEDLEGDDDFMPFMTIKSRDSGIIVFAGLMMPDTGSQKDSMADMMAALCVIHRAAEVVFASTSWMVTAKGARDTDLPPSQNPDRVEVIFMQQADGDGDRFHSAPVTRKDNRVYLGEWSSHMADKVGGRFGEAIHLGMALGTGVPPDMCAFFDAEIAAGRTGELAARVAATIDQAHRTAAVSRN